MLSLPNPPAAPAVTEIYLVNLQLTPRVAAG